VVGGAAEKLKAAVEALFVDPPLNWNSAGALVVVVVEPPKLKAGTCGWVVVLAAG